MKKVSLLIAGLILAFMPLHADEGMWLPMLIKRLNYVDLQKQGLHLTPEEIYSVNNASLKDAIVRLGGGFCTGEIISDQGLLLTNHHCGYGAIQALSSEKNNYLRDGFWAADHSEELFADFSVSFLVSIEDVSDVVNAELNEEMSLQERSKAIKEISDSLETLAVGETDYSAVVKSFYNGNEFYLFVYETFPDVRLVGTPPNSIGKFGGDTDNWIWPRQTGDFAMFRVYADKDNKPAEYSKDNQPYKPKHSLPISLKGIEEGDFAMIFGYPGSTDRYLTSHGVEFELDIRQPSIVKLRRDALDVYEREMNKSEKVRLQYASKHASISNYWKYFTGQQAGLKRLKVYDQKKAIENDLSQWIEADSKRTEEYGDVLQGFVEGYNNLKDANLARIYINEALFRIEAIGFSRQFSALKGLLEAKDTDQDKIDETVEALKAFTAKHFKNYSKVIDKDVFAAMVKAYYEDLPKSMLSEDFKKLNKKYKGNYTKMAKQYFSKSIFVDENKVMNFLNSPKASVINKDPIYQLMKTNLNYYFEHVSPLIQEENNGMERSKRLFVKALREMNPDKLYAADANSTMRFTHGQVKSYDPKDGVSYHVHTTAKGILEKENPEDYEFIVPEKLKELILKKDYGQYADKNGDLAINFISNNDITGGNSGSPVINGNGELIGIAFDGNWEAMSGDIAFEHDLQRTISVDIRYVLFVIDKFAGASHLVDEMKLVKE